MNGLLRNRCRIERQPADVVSGAGEIVSSWETVAMDIPCLVQPRSGSYRQAEYGRPQHVTHRMFFGYTTDVRVGDRVVLGETRYLVTFIADQMGRHLEADASIVTAP